MPGNSLKGSVESSTPCQPSFAFVKVVEEHSRVLRLFSLKVKNMSELLLLTRESRQRRTSSSKRFDSSHHLRLSEADLPGPWLNDTCAAKPRRWPKAI